MTRRRTKHTTLNKEKYYNLVLLKRIVHTPLLHYDIKIKIYGLFSCLKRLFSCWVLLSEEQPLTLVYISLVQALDYLSEVCLSLSPYPSSEVLLSRADKTRLPYCCGTPCNTSHCPPPCEGTPGREGGCLLLLKIRYMWRQFKALTSQMTPRCEAQHKRGFGPRQKHVSSSFT